ncbi:hypothetical protein [Paenibacillus tianjinensis]|uniref:Uncharacterized protein n=1 Tax=Paenibacillus tianjinensis TaxID=2810347 RepID=A0ABX7L520_9BACL|nr:hypothetical protein [Paenibacillus tianjinensis]QSF43092.1 hypothetical protein JRJ22_17580 [Paenibacillus tianjinensis]
MPFKIVLYAEKADLRPGVDFCSSAKPNFITVADPVPKCKKEQTVPGWEWSAPVYTI